MEQEKIVNFVQNKILECERDKITFGKYDNEQWTNYQSKKEAFEEILDWLHSRLTEDEKDRYFKQGIWIGKEQMIIDIEKKMDYLNDPYSDKICIKKSDWSKIKENN